MLWKPLSQLSVSDSVSGYRTVGQVMVLSTDFKSGQGGALRMRIDAFLGGRDGTALRLSGWVGGSQAR